MWSPSVPRKSTSPRNHPLMVYRKYDMVHDLLHKAISIHPVSGHFNEMYGVYIILFPLCLLVFFFAIVACIGKNACNSALQTVHIYMVDVITK